MEEGYTPSQRVPSLPLAGGSGQACFPRGSDMHIPLGSLIYTWIHSYINSCLHPYLITYLYKHYIVTYTLSYRLTCLHT